MKKHSYSGCRKSRSSGSALPNAPLILPPSASASSETGGPSPSPLASSPPSDGRGRAEESESVSRVGCRGVSSLPSRRSVGEEEGGRCREGLGFWGRV